MYSVKRYEDVLALFTEKSDADDFLERKIRERWDELLEEKVLEYIAVAGGSKDDIPNEILMMMDGLAQVEVAKEYSVVEDENPLENRIRDLEEQVDEWIRIFDVLNDRENRHKWLDYWREKEGKSDLWYPDGDQVYKDFWELKSENDELRLKLGLK